MQDSSSSPDDQRTVASRIVYGLISAPDHRPCAGRQALELALQREPLGVVRPAA